MKEATSMLSDASMRHLLGSASKRLLTYVLNGRGWEVVTRGKEGCVEEHEGTGSWDTSDQKGIIIRDICHTPGNMSTRG